ELTGGTPRRWIDGGVREHTAAQEGRHLVGIDLGMFGLAAVDGFHREGRPEDTGKALRGAEVREPVPGEEACNGHNQTVPRGRNGLQQWCRSGLHMAVEPDCSVMAPEPDVHTAGI